MNKLKVIFHVSETERLKNAYANINNMLKVENDYAISLLLNGQAASLVTDSPELVELAEKNIDLIVCQNSLNAHAIEHDSILFGIRVTPVGVIELISKQNAGYAYIKP